MARRDREETNKYARQWYARNKGRVLAKVRHWNKINKDRVNRTARVRNKRKREAKISLLRHRDGDRCTWWRCRRKLNFEIKDRYHPRFVTIDHRIPLSQRGRKEISNEQLMCRVCNLEKGRTGRSQLTLTFSPVAPPAPLPLFDWSPPAAPTVERILQDGQFGSWVDRLGELKINIDERQVLANAAAFALGRPLDPILIELLRIDS